jgi:hypothetical protein
MNKLLSELENPFNTCPHKDKCVGRVTKLEAALAEIREVWAGSEADFHIETAPEAYLQRLVKRCYTIAVEALR